MFFFVLIIQRFSKSCWGYVKFAKLFSLCEVRQPEAYSKLCQTSKMECLDIWKGSQYAVKQPQKKTHFPNTLCPGPFNAKELNPNFLMLLCSVSQKNQEELILQSRKTESAAAGLTVKDLRQTVIQLGLN